jgi:hypothetical protein
MKYLGSYSDGSQLDDAIRVNISTGEVELSAYKSTVGHYRLQITA